MAVEGSAVADAVAVEVSDAAAVELSDGNMGDDDPLVDGDPDALDVGDSAAAVNEVTLTDGVVLSDDDADGEEVADRLADCVALGVGDAVELDVGVDDVVELYEGDGDEDADPDAVLVTDALSDREDDVDAVTDGDVL